MKNHTKIMIGAMIVMATAMQGIAEISFANSEAITIDNTIPEPGIILLMLSASFIVILFRRHR